MRSIYKVCVNTFGEMWCAYLFGEFTESLGLVLCHVLKFSVRLLLWCLTGYNRLQEVVHVLNRYIKKVNIYKFTIHFVNLVISAVNDILVILHLFWIFQKYLKMLIMSFSKQSNNNEILICKIAFYLFSQKYMYMSLANSFYNFNVLFFFYSLIHIIW